MIRDARCRPDYVKSLIKPKKSDLITQTCRNTPGFCSLTVQLHQILTIISRRHEALWSIVLIITATVPPESRSLHFFNGLYVVMWQLLGSRVGDVIGERRRCESLITGQASHCLLLLLLITSSPRLRHERSQMDLYFKWNQDNVAEKKKLNSGNFLLSWQSKLFPLFLPHMKKHRWAVCCFTSTETWNHGKQAALRARSQDLPLHSLVSHWSLRGLPSPLQTGFLSCFW